MGNVPVLMNSANQWGPDFPTVLYSGCRLNQGSICGNILPGVKNFFGHKSFFPDYTSGNGETPSSSIR